MQLKFSILVSLARLIIKLKHNKLELTSMSDNNQAVAIVLNKSRANQYRSADDVSSRNVSSSSINLF